MVPCCRIVLKLFRGRRRSRGDEGFLRLETQVNAIQCFALFHLRLGTLLSNRIKNFPGAEAKPERRKIPEIRNPAFCGPALSPFPPEVRYPFFRIVLKIFRERGRSRGDDGYLRLETRGFVGPCFALSRLSFCALLSNRIKNFSRAEAKPERRRFPAIRNPG